MDIMTELQKWPYLVYHNPDYQNPFRVELMGDDKCLLDNLPPESTNNIYGYGRTLEEAASKALAHVDTSEPTTDYSDWFHCLPSYKIPTGFSQWPELRQMWQRGLSIDKALMSYSEIQRLDITDVRPVHDYLKFRWSYDERGTSVASVALFTVNRIFIEYAMEVLWVLIPAEEWISLDDERIIEWLPDNWRHGGRLDREHRNNWQKT